MPHIIRWSLIQSTFATTRKQQRRLASIENVRSVHLRNLVAGLGQLEEQERGFVWLPLAIVIGIDELARHPLPSLAHFLQEVDSDVAISDGSDAIQMHHRQRVGRRRVASVQRLGVKEHGLVKALLDTRSSQVHACEIEHSVRRATESRLVEVPEGQSEISSLRAGACEINEAQAVVPQRIVLGRRRHEVRISCVQVLRHPQAQAMHIAQQGQRSSMISARRQTEVVLGFAIVLLEAFDSQQVSLADGRGHCGVSAGRDLNEQVHLGRAYGLPILLVQVQPDQLHGLRHALAVDAGDALGHVDVVQRRRRTRLRHAVAVQVPIAHGHQRSGVACRGGSV
mmetsp:Transcript_21863/g.75183  ORF Transcript_21863/g.75183 Transcript_21863/m.75183 type:complete len:339 (+) Transcript_21863:769-1785(+)